MGAWGYELLGNDRACDLVLDLAKTQVSLLCEMFVDEEQDCFARLGALSAVLEGDTHLSRDVIYYLEETHILEQAVEDIDFLLKSKEWINGWNEPKKIKASLGKFKKTLLKIKKEYKEN